MNNSNAANKTALTKEQIHDQQISPLVAQIIAICKENNINSLLAFSLDDDLMCTSRICCDKEDKGFKSIHEASLVVRAGSIAAVMFAKIAKNLKGDSDNCDCSVCQSERKESEQQKPVTH